MERPSEDRVLGKEPIYTEGRHAQPAAEQMPDEPSMAALTAKPKVVFSSTLQEPLSWANTELVDGDAVEAVRREHGDAHG
jgi:hypothetical protein